MPGERANIFGKVFPPAIAVSVAGAHDGGFRPGNWWEKRKSEELFVHEVVGMMMALGEDWKPRPGRKIREGNQVPFSTATPACERSGHNIL